MEWKSNDEKRVGVKILNRLGAALKASFAGWDRPDRNSIDVEANCMFLTKHRKVYFLQETVTRKFRNCSEFKKHVDSFPQKVCKLPPKDAHIPESTQIFFFLTAAIHIWDKCLMEWKLLFWGLKVCKCSCNSDSLIKINSSGCTMMMMYVWSPSWSLFPLNVSLRRQASNQLLATYRVCGTLALGLTNCAESY